jgi:hypothetical protein
VIYRDLDIKYVVAEYQAWECVGGTFEDRQGESWDWWLNSDNASDIKLLPSQ